jgi:hypothetical protein
LFECAKDLQLRQAVMQHPDRQGSSGSDRIGIGSLATRFDSDADTDTDPDTDTDADADTDTDTDTDTDNDNDSDNDNDNDNDNDFVRCSAYF